MKVAKLSKVQVVQVRELIAAGNTHNDVAEKIGITVDDVNNVAQGRSTGIGRDRCRRSSFTY